MMALWKRPRGYTAASRLVAAFDAGKPLPAEDLKLFINGLRVFTADGSTDAHLQEFGRRTHLRGKQGKHELTAKEAEPQIEMAFQVLILARKLASQGSKRAQPQAIEEVAGAKGVHKRTVQRALAEHGEMARSCITMQERQARQDRELHDAIVGLMGGQDEIAREMVKALKAIKAKARDTKS